MQLEGNLATKRNLVFEPGKLSPRSEQRQILILEDDHFSQKMFDKIVADNLWDIEPVFAESCIEAQNALVRNHGIQLGILDVYLDDGKTGIDLYRQCMKKRDWEIPFIVTSAISERELIQLVGLDIPMPIFLKKPFHPEYCAALIKSILNQESRP